MGKKDKTEPTKFCSDFCNHDVTTVMVAEFEVSMHCNACERAVAKAISKCKGVEKFTTDMNKHRVVVTGRIDPNIVLKKLKKKTGKRVEIVDEAEDGDGSAEMDSSVSELIVMKPLVDDFECCINNEAFIMFSDENPNACSIM